MAAVVVMRGSKELLFKALAEILASWCGCDVGYV